MPMGPGKYDDECTGVRKETNADTVVLLIMNGTKGTGFSVQTCDPMFSVKLPQLLRNMATQIEEAAKVGEN